ncbi:glycosyltransferase [Eggerthellaceae bacterium 3-80]|nr:glycosyltransferase [bacterium D16-34]
MARVSVIIPVYNVENFVAQCLATVRAQTLDDIEIICVNDGSTDGSLAILEAARNLDDRIVVVDKPNGGLSSARNAGITKATAQYLMFVDSDDLLELNACERVVETFEDTGADIITFGATCYPAWGGNDWLVGCLSPAPASYTGQDFDLMFREDTRPYVWRSAVTRDFLERTHLTFREDVRFGEDQVFYFEAYPQAARCEVIADKLYLYRTSRKDSLMDQRLSSKAAKANNHVNIAEKIFSIWDDQGWLSLEGRRLLEWFGEFAGVDALSSEESACNQTIADMRELVAPYWDSLNTDELEGGTRGMFVRIMNPEPLSKAEAKKVLWLYFRHRYGWKFCVRKFGHDVLMRPFRAIKQACQKALPESSAHKAERLEREELLRTYEADRLAALEALSLKN